MILEWPRMNANEREFKLGIRRFTTFTGVRFAWAVLFAVATSTIAHAATPTVVLLVFDGFAPALIEGDVPPALARIQREGAFSHHVIPEFPAGDSVSTFTLSTGCRPANHGIVNDEFIDARRGFYDGTLDPTWSVACDHLHSNARKQGLRVMTWGWFETASETARVDADGGAAEIVRALQVPESERPQLLIAHFDVPQAVVRRAGLGSAEAQKVTARIDAIIGRVMTAIEALPSPDSVTLMVATNHGLLSVRMEVNLARILRNQDLDVEFAAAGATAFVYARPADVLATARAFGSYRRQFQVYLKSGVPPDWKVSQDDRVGALVLVANPPYIIESERRWWNGTAWLAPWLPEMAPARPFVNAGAGYPPSMRGMPGVLYAWGGSIAPAGEITRLNLVDIHPTVCAVLGIKPGEPVDGTVIPQLLVER